MKTTYRWVICLFALNLATSLPEVSAQSFFGFGSPSVAPTTPQPSFEQLLLAAQAVTKTFSNYKPGDCISRTQAEKVLLAMQQRGWSPVEAKALLQRVPEEKEFLYKALTGSDAGRALMRHTTTTPGGFDKLEMLSKAPNGEQLLQQVIASKDGYQLIEYLGKSDNKVNLGMALERSGIDFNQPTGKIYTMRAFIEALQMVYLQSTH